MALETAHYLFCIIMFVLYSDRSNASVQSESGKLTSGSNSETKASATNCPKFCFCIRNEYDAITEVDCSFSQLRSVPQLPLSGSLREVNLMGNMLESLHLEFMHLSGIETLQLSFNSINNLRSSSFTSLEKLQLLSLDYNNLTSLDINPFTRIPNSSLPLTINLMFNPIPCQCNLINIHNQLVMSKRNLKEFRFTCAKDSRAFYKNNQQFGFAEDQENTNDLDRNYSNSMLLEEYAERFCDEELMAPFDQQNLPQKRRIQALDVVVIAIFTGVFIIFVCLVVYFGIYKTCKHLKRRKMDCRQNFEEQQTIKEVNHVQQNGHTSKMNVSDNQMEDLIREFQISEPPSLPIAAPIDYTDDDLDSPPPRPPSRAVPPVKSPPPRPPKPQKSHLPDGLYSVAMRNEPASHPILMPTKVPIPVPPTGGILKNSPSSKGANSRNSVGNGISGNLGSNGSNGFRHSASEHNYNRVMQPEQVGLIRQSPQRGEIMTPDPYNYHPMPTRKSQSFYLQTSV